MSNILTVKKNSLSSVADSIRAKVGLEISMSFPDDFISSIDSIPDLKGSPSRFSKEELLNNLNFYDYDGTLLYSYTKEEAQKLTELPPLPGKNPYLVAQRWNWTSDEIKKGSFAADVACLYSTLSERTELVVEVSKSTGKTVTLESSIIVDSWDDDSTSDIGTNSHNYNDYGIYRIIIRNSSLPAYIMGNNSSTDDKLLREFNFSGKEHSVNQDCFRRCTNLRKVSVADSTPFFNSIRCTALRFIATSRSASKPVIIENCYSMTNYSPSGNSKQTTDYNADNCYSLERVVYPDITLVRSAAFRNDYGLLLLDFSHCSIVPTLENESAFSGITSDFKIIVPSVLYDEWISENNWSSYADSIECC